MWPVVRLTVATQISAWFSGLIASSFILAEIPLCLAHGLEGKNFSGAATALVSRRYSSQWKSSSTPSLHPIGLDTLIPCLLAQPVLQVHWSGRGQFYSYSKHYYKFTMNLPAGKIYG